MAKVKEHPAVPVDEELKEKFEEATRVVVRVYRKALERLEKA
jgi:hypothetical protein